MFAQFFTVRAACCRRLGASSCTVTSTYFIFLQKHFTPQLLRLPAQFLSSVLHTPLSSFEHLIEALFNSLLCIIMKAGGLFWGLRVFRLYCWLESVYWTWLAVPLPLRDALILSSGLSFLFVEPLLLEEDVKAALSEVNCLSSCVLNVFSFSRCFVSLHWFPEAILFFFCFCVLHRLTSTYWRLYCHHSRNKCHHHLFFLAFSLPSTCFSLLTSYLVCCRLAHHVWHDSARHSRLLLTRPTGYPLLQLKIWRPCRSLISPSALTAWTGFARACRWPARPARPSCGRQVRKNLHSELHFTFNA